MRDILNQIDNKFTARKAADLYIRLTSEDLDSLELYLKLLAKAVVKK